MILIRLKGYQTFIVEQFVEHTLKRQDEMITFLQKAYTFLHKNKK